MPDMCVHAKPGHQHAVTALRMLQEFDYMDSNASEPILWTAMLLNLCSVITGLPPRR